MEDFFSPFPSNSPIQLTETWLCLCFPINVSGSILGKLYLRMCKFIGTYTEKRFGLEEEAEGPSGLDS